MNDISSSLVPASRRPKTKSPAKGTSRSMIALRREILRAIREKRKELTGQLINKAMEGNASAAKLLFTLGDGMPPEETKRKKKRISLAQALAAEPQWVDKDPKLATLGKPPL